MAVTQLTVEVGRWVLLPESGTLGWFTSVGLAPGDYVINVLSTTTPPPYGSWISVFVSAVFWLAVSALMAKSLNVVTIGAVDGLFNMDRAGDGADADMTTWPVPPVISWVVVGATVGVIAYGTVGAALALMVWFAFQITDATIGWVVSLFVLTPMLGAAVGCLVGLFNGLRARRQPPPPEVMMATEEAATVGEKVGALARDARRLRRA